MDVASKVPHFQIRTPAFLRPEVQRRLRNDRVVRKWPLIAREDLVETDEGDLVLEETAV